MILYSKTWDYAPASYSHIYKLTTLSEENSKGSWHGWEIALEGKIEDVGMYHMAKEFEKSINAGEVTVKHSDGEDERAGEEAPF